MKFLRRLFWFLVWPLMTPGNRDEWEPLLKRAMLPESWVEDETGKAEK